MSKPVLQPTLSPGRARRLRCRQGRHLPDPVRETDQRGLLRTRCKLCGAELVQMFSRSWIVSGKLG